ncbi:tyrosine-type recombinase/integrase [Candidatus Igneacidithiobacillus taiwanensis]|uniref:tyrosine-type recombinase/integrase n=1 Tax=Candidatus Igneacidithiobacillus taiwanensis TaxID=1945924 RepID=UPI003916E783
MDFTAPNGQRIRRSTGTASKEQAQELHDRLKAEAWRQVKLGDRPKYTWDEAALRWIEEHGHKRTLKADLQRIEWFQQYLRGRVLAEITRTEIMALLERKRKNSSTATANRYLALIRAILRAAVDWEWIDTAPRFKPYQEPRRRIRWLTQEEAQRLLDELPEHLRDMVLFSLATGLRQSNVTGLQWTQVDLPRRVAWIHPDQSKNKKAIGISLGESALQVIRRQIGKHHTHVFTYEGKPVHQVNTKAWRKALQRAGIEDFRWHDLRHTWASWHVQSGTSLSRLQEMGGWESVEMVRRYAHLAPEHLAVDVANIEGLLQGINGTNMAQPPLRIVPKKA